MSSLLYADEDVAQQIVLALRQFHDVKYPSEEGTTGYSDVWHLRNALRDGRILLTVNHSDYRFLHRVVTSAHVFDGLPETHTGILSVAQRPEPQEWASAIHSLLSLAEPISGRLLVWHPVRNAWLEDAWRPKD